MATLEQLQGALVKADAAGNTDDARALADAIRQLRSAAETPDYESQFAGEQSAPTVLQRMRRGVEDMVDRGKQVGLNVGEKIGIADPGAADAFTKQANQEQLEYEAARGPDAGLDVARMSGNALATPGVAMGGGASVAGRVGYGALMGAESGALQFDPTNSAAGTVKNTALGGAGGAVAAPVAGALGDKLGAVGRVILGKIRGIGSAAPLAKQAETIIVQQAPSASQSQIVTLVDEATKEIKRTGSLNAEALARKANLVENGLTPTKASVTRNPADWTRERNLQKLLQSPDKEMGDVGAELTGVYQANDKALVKRIDKIGGGLPKGSNEEHGATVMQSLDDLSKASQKDVSRLYTKVRESRGEELASDARELHSTLEGLRDNTYAEKLVSSVTNKLKRFGMLDGNGELTDKTLTVTQAEELRKFVNTLPNDFGKKDIIRAIDTDVMSGVGEDAFGGARKAAQERFAMLANPATQKALNTLGELSEGKTAQNFIKAQVVSASEKDVGTLVATIGKLEKEPAEKAIASLRAGVMQHLRDKAVDEKSGKFSGAAFDKALGEIGEKKLNSIFGAQMAKQLKSLGRAAIDATFEPPYSAVNHSNTAPMLLSLIRGIRGTAGINLPFGLNETGEKAIERSATRAQLGETLAAIPESQLPDSPAMREIARLLARTAAPAAASSINQRQKQIQQRP